MTAFAHSRATPAVDGAAGLPVIPGGWTKREIALAGRTFRLTLPADPDAFLDDPDVHAEHQADGYMPYWPYLWPAALAMGDAVLRQAWPVGTRALEIGAGIGLVGLAAATAGLEVTVSDYRRLAVDVALHNARQNELAGVNGLLLDWRVPPLDRRFSLILGCDILYDVANHAPILALLETLLEVDGQAWIGDAGRQHTALFIEHARSREFSVDLYDNQDMALPQPVVGRFQRLVLSRATRSAH